MILNQSHRAEVVLYQQEKMIYYKGEERMRRNKGSKNIKNILLSKIKTSNLQLYLKIKAPISQLISQYLYHLVLSLIYSLKAIIFYHNTQHLMLILVRASSQMHFMLEDCSN